MNSVAVGDGVSGGFTDRHGGHSRPPYDSANLGGHVGDEPGAVTRNRAELKERVGGRPFLWLDQVHGTAVDVRRAGQELPVGPVPATDGAVTDRDDVVLAVLVADCVPVLAADPGAGVIGVAHAGRRGAAAGIAESLLEAMGTLGAVPRRTRVHLGPAICGRCYEVPRDLQEAVEAALPGSASTTTAGTPGLDLRAGLRRRLLEHGVGAVRVDDRCTAQDPELFSHRRDGRTGRQAGLLWRSVRDG